MEAYKVTYKTPANRKQSVIVYAHSSDAAREVVVELERIDFGAIAAVDHMPA